MLRFTLRFHSLIQKRRNMSKISSLLEIIFKEVGTFDNSIFKLIHLYLVDNYILYYDTFQNYQDRVEPPLKRKLFYHGTNLVLISAVIKFLLLYLFEGHSFKVNSGDIIFILLYFHKKYYIFITNVLLLTILVRLVIFYYEKNLKIYLNEIITTYNNSNNIFKYNNNQNSFLIIANSAYYFTNLNLIFFYVVSIGHIIIFNYCLYFQRI